MSTYPVGVLRALQKSRRALTHPQLRGQRMALLRKTWRMEFRYLRGQVARRNWRAVRNSFNGYLCEHDGHRHDCGSAWTKRAAERRAARICRQATS